MPFIVGAPRSGTTLLRMMLDAHPAIAIPPETGFLGALIGRLRRREVGWKSFLDVVAGGETWPDFHLSRETLAEELQKIPKFTVAEGTRGFYRLYARRFQKLRWGDKTPDYGLRMVAIGQLLPEARFIHIIRDGRDVAVSVRGLWFSPGQDFGDLGKDWSRRVAAMREQGGRSRLYREVRFEDLVTDTERSLRDICAFIDIDFHPRMLEYHRFSPERLQEHEARHRPDGSLLISKDERLAMQRFCTHPPDRSRIGGWRSVMSKGDHERFVHTAGALLRELGYL